MPATVDVALRDEFQEALRFIKTSIARMEQLISAMLRLSRDGKRELQPVELNMSELVRSVAEAFAHRAHTLGASIDIGSLPTIVSDRFALEQIFSNLLDNAIKYLRDDVPGKIVIAGEATSERVVYTVSDNGRGIADKDLERVFELFRRSGTQDVPGEGIGLTYVRMLAQRLGGKIEVTSTIGTGTTFTISLPHDLSQEQS